MDKKKIIAIVVFIALGLFIFTFANPAPSSLDPVEVPGQGESDDESKDEVKGEEEKDEEDEPVGNVQENDEQDEVDYYQLALDAIIKAEQSLIQGDVDSAKDLIEDVDNNKEDLIDRVENVQNVIDYNKLLTELENKTNSSTNKDELNTARDYNTTTDLANKLASLNDDANKEKLLNRYNNLLPKLNDTTAPVVTGLDKEYTNQIVNLTITDESSFTATLNGENYISGTEIKEDGRYTLVAIDASFNETVVEFVYDATKPELVPSYWRKTVEADKDATFTDLPIVSGKDNLSTNVTVELVNNTVDMSTPGEYKLQYVTTDEAGNKAYNDIFITVVDTTEPVITINNWKNLTLELGSTYVDEGATAYDKVDGDLTDKIEVKYYYYDKDGNRINPDPTEIKLDKVGEFVIVYAVTDNAGNREELARRITVVDTTAPEIKLDVLLDNDYTNNGNVTITDGDSFDVVVKINGEEKHRYSGEIYKRADLSFLGDGEYEVIVTDASGNVSSKTFILDKTAPTAEISMSNNNGYTSTNKDVTVTLVAGENILDIEGWTKVDSKTFTKVYSENAKYSVEITDLAGNKSTIKYEVKRIDKVAPTIDVVDPNRYNIEVNTPYVEKGYSAYDEVDKDLTDRVTMTYLFLPLGSGNWEEADGVDTSKLGTYKITYYVTDKAGNEAKATRSFEIVDSSLPVITVKEESIGTISENIFSNVSFKLYDKHLVTKVYINETEKILIPNSWSDLNDVAVGKNGGVYGKNTITLVDAYGNEAKYEFILDNKVPQLAPEKWSITLEADKNATFVCPDMTQYGTDEYGVAKVELDQYFNDNLTNVDVTKPGKFICRYVTTDKAGNRASNDIFYNVVDTTAPKTNAANILVNGDANEQKVFYATYGDKIYAYVRFDEELKNVPTFTLINNGNEYVIDEKDVTVRSFDDGQYQYSIYYEITSDTTMTDGEITMHVSNIEDLYGNKAADIVKPTNGHIVYLDTIEPVMESLTIVGGTYNKTDNTYYANAEDYVYVYVVFNEKLDTVPTLKIGDKEYIMDTVYENNGTYRYYSREVKAENLEEGLVDFEVYGYKDIAGNEGTKLNNDNITLLSQSRVIVDKNAANAKPLYILARDDANYRLSISDGEYLRVEANFDEELKELPILKVGSQTMEFDRCKFNSTNNLYVCVADMKIDNEIAKLVEGEVIPFEVINVIDLAGNETSFDNSNVTKYYQNGKLIYDQVKYENPFVSMTFHNSTNYKLNEENGNNDLSLTEAKIGDNVRVFVRFNQDLAIDNFKPVIVIGGVTKKLKLSNVYSDGTKDYGTDVTIIDEMNLTPNKKISFVIKNIVLENGNTLPNLTQNDITSNTLSGVTYIED